MSDAEFNPKDAMETKSLAGTPIDASGLRPCPHCGYCPTCGKPNFVPSYPPFPYNPGPYWGPWIVTSGTTIQC